jgi:hypothetical protein
MPSPRCTLDRWTAGSGSSYTPKNSEAKEMEDKLKKMMAERDRVDTMWQQQASNPNNNIEKGK